MMQRQFRAAKKSAKGTTENANASVDKEKDISDSFRSQQSLGKAVIEDNERFM